MNKLPAEKKMLVFHSAYTYDFLKKYGMEIFVQARDAGCFFDQVLTVSPVANLQYKVDDFRNFTKPELFQLDPRNVVLEGKTSRYRILKKLPVLNFLIAQISLLHSIFKFGKLQDVQLVRAEDPRFNGLYAYIFSRILKKPLVVGLWGNPGRIREMNQTRIMPRLFPTIRSEEIVERFILNKCDAVLAQNQENLSYALDVGVIRDKTHFTELGVGIDKSHFLAKEIRLDVRADFEAWNAVGVKVFMCISRLEAIKMVDHAVLALRTLKNVGFDFKLILVGDGREFENLKLLVKREDLVNRVIFAGNRSQEWIAGALNLVDVNIAPLCGRSLLEASLAGVPAVAYDVDWHKEIVLPNVTGLLVTNLDYQALGEAILRLCDDDGLRIQMANSIKQIAHDMANPEKIATRQRKIYQDLVFNTIAS